MQPFASAHLPADQELGTASIRARLTVALVTPLILIVLVGAVLAYQVSELSENARLADHSHQVIAKLYEVQKSIIDQETGLRGFLITSDRAFLEPYERAHPELVLDDLNDLVGDSRQQTENARVLRASYDRWNESARGAIHAEGIERARSLGAMFERKRHMDEIRGHAAHMLEAEESLERQRTSRLADSRWSTRALLLGLLGMSGFVLAFVSRRNLSGAADAYGASIANERKTRQLVEAQAWVRNGHMRVAQAVQGDLSVEELGARFVRALAPEVEAEVAALFIAEPGSFRRKASFGLDVRSAGPDSFAIGEGLVGRAAQSGQLLHLRDVPSDFLKIRSGTGERHPAELVLMPALYDGVPYAVVELAFLRPADARVRELVERVGEPLAIAIRSAQYKLRLRELLEESQRQAEELQTQQEELRVANEELQEQSTALLEAHRQLEERQEAVSASNRSLEFQAKTLREVQQALIEKATELERASQYKSEFLANMSHELRTPLNSSLILAKLLVDNKHGNLTPEQVRYAQTIYSAGNDLLSLINDILDLSKIEAGRMDVHAVSTPLARIVEPVTRMFEPIAAQKGLSFSVEFAPGLPTSLVTDLGRVQQILKNLLSNALKFTERGSVGLRLAPEDGKVRFAVTDTGVGIAESQHELIFEAFRQADGTANRKYGGSGLGLSISRDLARLLGGELTLQSQIGRGSTFSFTLPEVYEPVAVPGAAAFTPPPPPPHAQLQPSEPTPQDGVRSAPGRTLPKTFLPDDREHLSPGQRLVLVVEDDTAFANILLDLAHELEFQCVVASTADEATRLASELPLSAVILDVHLPDHSGLSVLDRLKRNPATRHVPVHVVSVADFSQQALAMGAMGYALKPVTREGLISAFRKLEERLTTQVRRLLVVEDDAVARDSICQLLGAPDVETVAVGTVGDALAQLRANTFDCMVTDLALPDASGFDLLETMAHDDDYPFPPAIVYTGRSLTSHEEQRLRRYSSSIIVKGARSPERLLDEVTLFLHQVEAELPPERQRMLQRARDREALFEGRHILIVEDDVRNIFALTSVLEPKGAHVLIARNGREALESLEKHAQIDLVLMDIMMPEMDGLTATREIRAAGRWAKLPIIALTAKAMSDDQDRCLQAGASDYIAKPIDVEMLLSLLRVWMPR